MASHNGIPYLFILNEKGSLDDLGKPLDIQQYTPDFNFILIIIDIVTAMFNTILNPVANSSNRSRRMILRGLDDCDEDDSHGTGIRIPPGGEV